jgi:hypothetical protein
LEARREIALVSRGEVGTVVEALGDTAALAEFCDVQWRAYAVVSCPRANLLVLGSASAPREDLISRAPMERSAQPAADPPGKSARRGRDAHI